MDSRALELRNPPKRALVARDWEASGIWRISPRKASAYAPQSVQEKGRYSSEARLGWADLLSQRLLAALKQWNDAADHLYGPRVTTRDEVAESAFWLRGAALGRQAQSELGAEWEVLYQTSSGAWTWCREPLAWSGATSADD